MDRAQAEFESREAVQGAVSALRDANPKEPNIKPKPDCLPLSGTLIWRGDDVISTLTNPGSDALGGSGSDGGEAALSTSGKGYSGYDL